MNVGGGGESTAVPEERQPPGVKAGFPADDGEIPRAEMTGGCEEGDLSVSGWLCGDAKQNLMDRAPRRGGLPSPGRGTSRGIRCVEGTGGESLWSGVTGQSGGSVWSGGSGGSGENTETDGTSARAGRRGR